MPAPTFNHIILIIFLIICFFLPAYADDFHQKAKNTETGEFRKSSRIMFGMKTEDVMEILGDGCKPKVDTDYKPKGVANYIKCKKLKIEFLHNNLYCITYKAGFDLKIPLTPFHDNKYNLPADIQDKIRWGMGIKEFIKVLYLWAKMLGDSGIKFITQSENYSERLNNPLHDNECSISKSKKECWVVFGPKSEASPLERVQWIFSFDQQFPFDPKYRGLREIHVLDRDKQGIVLYNIK